MVSLITEERSASSSIWNSAFGAPRELADKYYELLALPTEPLLRELAKIAAVEHSLPEPLRYAAAKSRLLAWLELSPEDRRIIARSFEAAVAMLPPELQASRRDAERAAALNGLTYSQFRELAGLLSWSADEAALSAA